MVDPNQGEPVSGRQQVEQTLEEGIETGVIEDFSYSSSEKGDLIQARPYIDALREGYIVGQAPHNHVTINPLDHPTDADAIQKAHDRLTKVLTQSSSSCNQGIVWIPGMRPDKSQFEISKTVVFSGNGSPDEINVFPRGWGYTGRQGPYIQCSINDGSPMFKCQNMKGQGSSIGDLNIEGLSGGEDAEVFRFKGMTGWKYNKMDIRGVGGSNQDGAIVFDSHCYNSFVNNVRYNGSGEDVTQGNFFAFRDTEDGNPPGEIKFGNGNSTYAPPSSPYNHAFDITVSVSDLLIRGRYEGAGGDATIYSTRGNIHLGDGLELGRVEDNDGSGTNRVRFTGFELSISPGVQMTSANNTGGANVYASPGEGHIGSFTTNVPKGDVIRIPDDTGANKLVVPREQIFEGSVSYPEVFHQLIYPDGWQRTTTGTVTVPTGGKVRLGDDIVDSEEAIRVETSLRSTSEDVFYVVEKGSISQGGRTARIVDKQSTSDYIIQYVIERRSSFQ